MAVLQFLNQPHINKIQVLFLVQLSYIYKPFKRWYRRLYLRLNDLEGQQIDKKSIKNINKQLGFSDQYLAIAIYKRFGFFYMIYIIFRSFLPLKTILDHLNLPLPSHCYIFGRFMLWGPMAEGFVVLVSLYHVTWQFSKQHIDRYHKLDAVAFMLYSDKKTIEENYGRSGEEVNEDKLSMIDRYLCSIMCFTIKYKAKTFFVLRPNRTREARNQLQKVTILLTISITLFNLVLTLIIAPLSTYSVYNDIQYVQDFPGCYPLLDEMYRKNQLTWSSVTLTGHKLLAVVIDTIENLVVWIDNGIAVTFGIAFPYLLNRDLAIYWSHLYNNLESLLLKVRVNSIIGNHTIGYDRCRSRSQSYSNIASKLRANLTATIDQRTDSSAFDTLFIQEMLNDFFKQVKLVDELISKVCGMGILVWLSYFSFSYYVQYTKPSETISILILRIATLIIFLTMLLMSAYMFRFRRNVMKSHPIVCSLMAYDSSPHKIKYMGTLDYYTEKNRGSYTVFNQPYTPANLLTALGWTVSCIVLIKGAIRRYGASNTSLVD